MKTDVLELMETKDFGVLTAAEQSAVLNEMTEAEYLAERKLMISAMALAKDEKPKLIPNPQILMMAKEKLPKKKAGALLFFQHKVPTWAAVAACLLLFFGIHKSGILNESNPETSVITETIHDTVFTEKIIVEQPPSDTVIEYVYVDKPEVIYEIVDNSKPYFKEDPSYENLYFKEDPYCNIMSCYEPTRGNTVQNDTLLLLIQDGLY